MWIEEFLRLMTDSTLTLEAINHAYALKDKNLPAKIYKFRTINDYSISNLESDTVWICSADKYNDPYECSTTWSTQSVMQEHVRSSINRILGDIGLENHLTSAEIDFARKSGDPMRVVADRLIARDQEITRHKRDEMVNVLMKVTHDISLENIYRMNEFMQRGMKICSFSTRVDSTVMWGHYASSHTGFAMEYDIAGWHHGDIRRNILHPVVYAQTLFDSTKYLLKSVERADFNNLFGAIAAIHKSPDWSYEKEWRFVLPMGESFSDQNYPISKPSAVYMGSRIGDRDKHTILEITKRRRIPIYQMSLSPLEFKLIPNKIN
jgi:Protein of unknown function (DUF2971)